MNMVTSGENEVSGGGIDWEGHVHNAIIKIDNQQGPAVYNLGNSIL